MRHATVQKKVANRDVILTKAILNLALSYKLKGKELSEIIGISEASATRLNNGTKLILENSKEGELALLLIRLYRSLNVLVGNNPDKAQAWLHGSNRYFTQKPFDLIKRVDGLVAVVEYLDAMRGKT